jgi:hypothetical protein
MGTIGLAQACPPFSIAVVDGYRWALRGGNSPLWRVAEDAIADKAREELYFSLTLLSFAGKGQTTKVGLGNFSLDIHSPVWSKISPLAKKTKQVPVIER